MIPKILIIEGPDNCGKNFVINIINNIISENKSWCSPHVEYHCTKPKIPDNIKSSINKINGSGGASGNRIYTEKRTS